MATYLEKMKQQQEQQTPQAQYSGLAGVSENTQANQLKYQQGYQPNEQTQQAQQKMQNVQNQRPQSYTSKYGAALDGILQQIQNPGKFKYEFNSDNLFKSYADLLSQNAKQASQNAMGQAAGLTGGYGNSYAMAAGNQAYQEAIRPLYDRGMQLAQFARENYDKDRADLYNQMGAIKGMDESDYGRYLDTMDEWRKDEANATEAYRDERDFGYQDYANMLDYWQKVAAAENADYRTRQQFDWNVETDARDFEEAVRQANLDEAYRRDSLVQSQKQFEASTKLEYDRMAEQIRQFDATMSEDQRQYNQNMAANWVSDILANGQIPSTDLLAMAGLSYEDAQRLVAKMKTVAKKATPTPAAKDPNELKNLLINNILNTDYITPEERKESLEWLKKDQGPQYAPQTSNLDTPVHFTQEANLGSGIVPKTVTGTMNPLRYNAMIRQMFEEDMKKSNK